MKLVIIEGAGKKETIEKYLGRGYKVFATKGHVRDLPEKRLAVNIKKNFEPKYEILPDKKDIVKKMQLAAEAADEVLLATDPDREGEAIAWHVANILNIPSDKKARIVFNEISKKAVSAALANPREINLNLVDAQQARRVLDRLVGYKVSPFLCKRIQNNLSAGRVQSVTLRLVVERDREIANFKPQEYWNFFSLLEKEGIKFSVLLHSKNGKKITLSSKDEVEKIKQELVGKDYIISDIKRSVSLSKPAPPFITSSMQQEALNKLGMSLKQTTMAAQNLYEGVDLPGEGKVALITYIRTDSTRVSEDAIREAKAFIAQKYGEQYIPSKPNIYASKKGAQDAHEAIRPISLERTPESVKDALPPNLYKLYKLIYDRFLASQMSPAKYDSIKIEIECGNYTFKVSGKTLIFPGYTAVYRAFNEEQEQDGEDSTAKLPHLETGEKLKFIEFNCEQKFTKPPAHYTEASLVKTMEEKGIGRPATYMPTVSLIQNRKYVQKEGKHLKATKLGFLVNDILVKYFPDIMDLKFTAEMEERLDKIEDGGTEWQSVVASFYSGLAEQLKIALSDKEPEESPYECPNCGKKLVYKSGKFGRFLACSGYPECKFTQQIDVEGKPVDNKDRVSDVICENCGRNMVVKKGRFGEFLACPGYPECKNIKSLEPEKKQERDLPPCPDCGKPLVERRAKTLFYGCSGYPDCKFVSSYKPVKEKCSNCGSYMVEKKFKDGIYHVCSKKDCGNKIKLSEDKE